MEISGKRPESAIEKSDCLPYFSFSRLRKMNNPQARLVPASSRNGDFQDRRY
jgi:hypothetical protein